MFLIQKDYYNLITSENLDVVLDGEDQWRIDAELSAIEEIKGYLNNRYDTDVLFKQAKIWAKTTVYTTGDFILLQASNFSATATYVVDNLVTHTDGYVYICILAPTANQAPGDATYWTKLELNESFFTALQDSTGVELITNAAFFKLGDTRNALIKTYVTDITLYNLHSRINPRNIPDFRVGRRDDAIAFLKATADPRMNVHPDFPTRDPDTDDDDGINKGYDISWGSVTKTDNGESNY